MTAPLFLVETAALGGDSVVVAGAEARHAGVKRLRAGEEVLVADGVGMLVRGVVTEAAADRFVVEVRSRENLPAPDPRFVVVQAFAKGGRDTDAVEAMTEVGVDEVVPWTAARSIARPGARGQERWQLTARAAAKQSRRAWVPVVAEPVSTAGVGERLRNAALGVVLHEDATEPLASVAVPDHGDVVVVVGPEGGIAPEELTAFAAAGAVTCRLGEPVLRTSTAGVAALSVLSAARRWR